MKKTQVFALVVDVHVAQGLRNLFQAALDLLHVVLEERDEHAFFEVELEVGCLRQLPEHVEDPGEVPSDISDHHGRVIREHASHACA